MINTVIAYDDEDFDLGDYFEDSHADISASLVQNVQITTTSIRGLNCTEEYLKSNLENLNGNSFVFIVLAHGNEEEIIANEIFIRSSNCDIYSKSLFYSCACSTGYALGTALIDIGCHAFVGYYDTVYVMPDFFSVFYQCQNFAIKSFLSNDETIETAYNKMKDYYNQEIDRLVSGTMDELLAATSLISNRDCLILLGDKTVTRTNFHNE